MKNFNTIILLFIMISFCSCDEELPPLEYDTPTAKEQLLMKDWTYDYILMGTDSVKGMYADSLMALGIDTIRALAETGEPQTTGVFEATNQFYRRYGKDHSYSFIWQGEVYNFNPHYGTGDNYQPNFGYWYLSENGEGNVLIHNKLQTYEKRYEILELTGKTFRIKLIGGRTSYLTTINNDGDPEVMDTVKGSWIEVFVPRSITNN